MRHPAGEHEDWSCVDGCDFSNDIRDACDFADTCINYLFTQDLLENFIGDDLPAGCRLFLALNLPKEKIGAFLLAESDPRLIKVAKSRLNNDGIIVTGAQNEN